MGEGFLSFSPPALGAVYPYTLLQWLFLFYLYSFVGWVWECVYCSVKSRRLQNRGFMKGPFLPIYGSGAIVMLAAAAPFTGYPVLIFLAGVIAPSILEYATGAAMEALFKVRYWDYSNQPLNLNGHICLAVSIGWGGATLLLTQVLHAYVERWMLAVPYDTLRIVTWIVTAFVAMDFALSFKAALDLRNILVRMEAAKHEMELLQRRLDVVIALADESFAHRRETLSTRYEDLKASAEEKLGFLRKQLITKPTDRLRGAAGEIAELGSRIAGSTAERTYLTSMKDFLTRSLLRQNPFMTSREYGADLEELRKALRDGNRPERSDVSSAGEEEKGMGAD